MKNYIRGKFMFKDCIAFLTGGSSFLGRDIAIRLAQYGAHVIFTYNSNEVKAQEVLAMITASGGSGEALKLDLQSEKSITEVFDSIREKHNKLDFLINNAGIGTPVPTQSLSLSEWEKHMFLNLTAPFLCIKNAIEMLKKTGHGKIVNISSVAALTGGSFGPHYAASKAGLIGLTKSIAREYGRYGITANVIAPGPIRSDMTDSLGDHVINKILEATPQGRLGESSEVSEIVCQLLNPNVNYITGQTIVVDGGRYMI